MNVTPLTAMQSADRANYGAATYPRNVAGMATVRERVARINRARSNGYSGALTRAEVAALSARGARSTSNTFGR